jgi:hypothetical protein
MIIALRRKEVVMEEDVKSKFGGCVRPKRKRVKKRAAGVEKSHFQKGRRREIPKVE